MQELEKELVGERKFKFLVYTREFEILLFELIKIPYIDTRILISP